MTVYEFLKSGKMLEESVAEKLLNKIIKNCDVKPSHADDVRQEVLIAWTKYEVKDEYLHSVPSILSFATDLGKQATYSHKRVLVGALNIPRRVIKEHRDEGVVLVTDSIAIDSVREDEVTEGAGSDLGSVFELPIQSSLLALPMIDQHIQRDFNAGESLENVKFSSGMEKRALNGKLVNLTKADVFYVEQITNEIKEECDSDFEQPSLLISL
ncbi:hypothetical protein [Pseudoalteromonas marina]|uniref:Uncharacterized protein n=1 Tax=Pseudoalteromonas marina TaxID=267375 RepID=A0ABT9FC92_9GAMM|nr:hypothetical protein [Pseudoalteromonas marina]MDP2564399.1 hypothetical protein [Pseudoalteromonas marina]